MKNEISREVRLECDQFRFGVKVPKTQKMQRDAMTGFSKLL